MANWSPKNILVTRQGDELLSKLQIGSSPLQITRVVTGSGRVSESNLYSQTTVSAIKQEMTVRNKTASITGSTLELEVSNESLSESYIINQIGVYAQHDDMGEFLYMIAQCDEGTGDYMPLPESTPTTMEYTLNLIHGTATELNIEVVPAGFVSYGEFDRAMKELKDNLENIRPEDISNEFLTHNTNDAFTTAKSVSVYKQGNIISGTVIISGLFEEASGTDLQWTINSKYIPKQTLFVPNALLYTENGYRSIDNSASLISNGILYVDSAGLGAILREIHISFVYICE